MKISAESKKENLNQQEVKNLEETFASGKHWKVHHSFWYFYLAK